MLPLYENGRLHPGHFCSLLVVILVHFAVDFVVLRLIIFQKFSTCLWNPALFEAGHFNTWLIKLCLHANDLWHLGHRGLMYFVPFLFIACEVTVADLVPLLLLVAFEESVTYWQWTALCCFRSFSLLKHTPQFSHLQNKISIKLLICNEIVCHRFIPEFFAHSLAKEMCRKHLWTYMRKCFSCPGMYNHVLHVHFNIHGEILENPWNSLLDFAGHKKSLRNHGKNQRIPFWDFTGNHAIWQIREIDSVGAQFLSE